MHDGFGDGVARDGDPSMAAIWAFTSALAIESGRFVPTACRRDRSRATSGWSVSTLHPLLRLKNYDELNAWLLDKGIIHVKAHRHSELTEQTAWQVFEAERPKLVPYAGGFDGFHAAPAERSVGGTQISAVLTKIGMERSSATILSLSRALSSEVRQRDCHPGSNESGGEHPKSPPVEDRWH
jgi:hypothetical protein